ncbi:MAG: glutamate-1-semialdehyde-2,1-aminomutase [Acidobacteriia bacterium]|nr:glutamate-1-semialdehyde-2,1-aminomutase [Terriglobia bacterium]
MQHDLSSALFEEAQQVIPGGVNSPARAFRAVGREPVFIARGDGCRLCDVDGNEYVDFVGSWGPLFLGHRHPGVIAALEGALRTGTSFGAPTVAEVKMAELICEIVPSIEMVRLVNSGTEATMSALRVARGYTGRELAIKFVGNYHGHVDSLLVKAGSGLATLGISDSGGVPAGFAATTLPLPYNDADAVREAFSTYGDRLAAVILEPVAGNMGCVPPRPGFLQALRDLCSENGTVLIFDEVMTGFRVALGGAQSLYGVTPDMTTLGKVIGGGLPIGAFGGRSEIMQHVAPLGGVYQGGTLSGNPLAVAGGLAMLRTLRDDPGIYDRVEASAARLQAGVMSAAEAAGVKLTSNRVGSMVTFFFTDRAVYDWDGAASCDTELFGRYFREMLARGIYLPCSQFEALFVSDAHSETEIDLAISAAADVLAGIGETELAGPSQG